MSILYNDLINNSDQNVNSFIIMKNTKCMRQVNDTIFEETNDFVNEKQVYDGNLVYKKNNKYYLFLGYDDLLEYEIYIPIIYDNNEINIMKLVDYQKE